MFIHRIYCATQTVHDDAILVFNDGWQVGVPPCRILACRHSCSVSSFPWTAVGWVYWVMASTNAYTSVWTALAEVFVVPIADFWVAQGLPVMGTIEPHFVEDIALET